MDFITPLPHIVRIPSPSLRDEGQGAEQGIGADPRGGPPSAGLSDPVRPSSRSASQASCFIAVVTMYFHFPTDLALCFYYSL